MQTRLTRLILAAFGLALYPVTLGAQGPQPSTPEIVPAPPSTLPLKLAPTATRGDITPKDLMTRLYIFADDSMMGREAGTEGNFKGTAYIAGEVKRLGLVPMGEDGTYFQTLPFKTLAVDSSSTLAAGGDTLSFGSDWAGQGMTSLSQPDLPVVFGGVIGDSNQIAPEETVGKVVIFAIGPRTRLGQRSLGRLAPDAVAVAAVLPDQFIGYIPYLSRPSTFLDDPDNPVQTGGHPILLLTGAAAGRFFDAPLDQLTPGAAGRNASLDFKASVNPVPFPARNVVAVLPGSDPKVKGQYVAIGAHNDHIGFNHQPVDHDSMRIFLHLVRPGGAEDGRKQATPAQQDEVNRQLAAWRADHPGSRPDSISNGADDDGSGSVSVLEIAERLSTMKQKPRRSILFVWHVGEEKGLLGSQWFTDHPTVPRDSIVAQLNMDMVGRGDAWDVTGQTKDGEVLRGGEGYLQVVGGRRLSSELGDVIEQVNGAKEHRLTLDYAMDANGHPMNIYCRSDHYEYARYGIPIAFFTTGGHSDYHQVTDEPEYIDYDHMARVDKFVTDVLLKVANLDHRLVVDQPKPDPKGRCQQ